MTNLASQKLGISLMVFFFWPIKLLETSREMTFTRDIKQAHVTRNLTAWYTPRCVTLEKCDIKLFFRTFGLDITCFNLALTSNQPKEICEYRCHKLKTNMKRNLRYSERWLVVKKTRIPYRHHTFHLVYVLLPCHTTHQRHFHRSSTPRCILWWHRWDYEAIKRNRYERIHVK